MTLSQFLKELSKTSGWEKAYRNVYGTWYIRQYTYRKNKARMFCPITKLANKKAKRFKYDVGKANKAGKYLGLSEKNIIDIINAADGFTVSDGGRDISKLFNKLLKACKL